VEKRKNVAEIVDYFSMSLLRVRTTFDSEESGLKTFVRNFLHSIKVDCNLERTEDGKTALEIETLQGSMPHVKRMLLIALDKHFNSSIPVPTEWVPIALKETTIAKLTHTNVSFARQNSSGENSLQDDIFPDDSVDMQSVLRFARDGYSRVNSFLSETPEKVLYVSYKGTTEAMEVSNCTSWQLFMKMISDSKLLNVGAIIRKIYFQLENGIRVNVTNVATLTAGTTYFIETDLNVPKEVKFSTMNEFFEKLKTEQEVDDDDIQTIKDCFVKQKIKFRQLMATGDLALTDAELKDYGITQGGLRKAILSVIRSNV
jgi:hypothetical protein